MNFKNIDWADSRIEKIVIEYNCAKLYVFNDDIRRNLCVSCTGFIGLTNLCIWDDQVIDHAEIHQIADDDNTPFIQMLFLPTIRISIMESDGSTKAFLK